MLRWLHRLFTRRSRSRGNTFTGTVQGSVFAFTPSQPLPIMTGNTFIHCSARVKP